MGCHFFLQRISLTQPKDETHVSCIGRWVLYHWASREALATRITFRKETQVIKLLFILQVSTQMILPWGGLLWPMRLGLELLYPTSSDPMFSIQYGTCFVVSWHSFIFNFCFISEYSWFDNAVLVSGVQQSDSVIHLHIYILFQILFSLWSLQRIELRSLLYSTGNSAHILLKLFSSELSVVMDPSWRT